MCDPVTAAIVLSVATTGASIVTQVRAAKAQNQAIASTAARVATETNLQATEQVNERLREARREQGRIKVAAGEAGLQLSGSVEGLLMDSGTQASLANERTQGNRRRALEGNEADANAAFSKVENPSTLGMALQLGSAGMQGYSSGKSLQIARQKAG